MHRRLALLTVLSSLALVGVAGPAQAGLIPTGISDNKGETFTDPLFAPAGFKYARLVTPWNSINSAAQRDGVDYWMGLARSQNMRIVVSLGHSKGNKCPRRPCTLPSVRSYTTAFKKFHKRYPFVKDINPWNEINSPTQPTAKNPKLSLIHI